MQNEIAILDELKKQHSDFVSQRDSIQINLQQLIGAIHGLEIAINKLESKVLSYGGSELPPIPGEEH